MSALFPSLLWKVRTDEKVIFLTFDDGPVPGITPWVLTTLDEYNAKATFFCIGNNVSKHGDIYKEILQKGHVTGNHTWSHLNGWKVGADIYKDDVEKAAMLIESSLFRPPYGKITFSLLRALKKKFRIVMWDVLSRDYDQNYSADQCLRRVKSRAGNGSVIVFHDSIRAGARLKGALPEVLKHFSGKGFEFKSLPAS